MYQISDSVRQKTESWIAYDGMIDERMIVVGAITLQGPDDLRLV
jgi:hypothetical protein